MYHLLHRGTATPPTHKPKQANTARTNVNITSWSDDKAMSSRMEGGKRAKITYRLFDYFN